MRNKYTKEFLEDAVKDCETWAAVCRKVGVTPFTGAQTYLAKQARKFNVDISHFKSQGWSKGKTFGPKRPVEDYLSGVPIRTSTLRERLIKEGYKENKCIYCGIEEWFGYSAPLELDHIDSNPENNQLDNLQILCSNCHTIKTKHKLGRLVEWNTR